MDGPIQAAQKGQALYFLVRQRLAAQGLQVATNDPHPTGFALMHALQPVIDAGALSLQPRLLGLGGITRQAAPRLIRQELVLLFHIVAPRPAEPDHQQAEGNQ
ncbi:hypothetical protein D3C72_1705900 [compost metagenome]